MEKELSNPQLLCDFLSSLVYHVLVNLCGGDETNDRSKIETWHATLRSIAYSTLNIAKQKNWNAEIRTVPAYFSRFRDENHQIHVVSSFGLQRTFSSAHDFGQVILQELEALFRERQSDLWIRSALSNGMIYITTASKIQEMRCMGLSPCPFCPYWFKGLWWHIQVQHSSTHAQAREEQLKQHNPLALVIHQPKINSFQLENSKMSVLRFDQNPTGSFLSQLDPWSCVKRGDIGALKQYLFQNPSFNPQLAIDCKGARLIHWAAGGGFVEMLDYLVRELGCDPEIPQLSRRSFGGRTSLHWAARNGHKIAVEYLMNMGVNACAETQDGTTAFGWAAWQGHLNILQYLYSHAPHLAHSINRFGCNAVLWAAQGSFEHPVPVISWLECVGCDVYLVNDNGHGLLHKAAQRGRFELATWFVTRLFSIFKDDDTHSLLFSGQLFERLVGPDTEGCTPSDMAGIEEHADLADYLAIQEAKLIVLYLERVRRISTPSYVPSWFESAVPSVHSSSSWESWAGVDRMRAAVDKTIFL